MVQQETTQEQPGIQDEAVGLDTLRAQAYEAAALGDAAPGPGAQPWLLAGLKAQETFLQATVLFFQSSSGQQVLSHAAEWMLDNFYLAQQSLRQIHEDMPRGFYRQLPKLAAGPLAGYPRIYNVAQQLVAGSGARLDMEQVQRFVRLYQDIRPLTTGELWALPIMLRLSILAALAQAAEQVTHLSQQLANPHQRSEPPSRPLSGSLTADEIVANCFTSLRTIGTHDWQDFFESVSRVEQILRDDPAAVYAGWTAPARPISPCSRRAGPGDRPERAGSRAYGEHPGAGGLDQPAAAPDPWTPRARQMSRRGRGWSCRQPPMWATICWTMAART